MKLKKTLARGSRLLIAALAVGLLFPFVATADHLPNPDQTAGPNSVVDPTPDPDIFYTAITAVQVWYPGNASNPCPNTTQYCYVYTLTNSPTPISSVDLIGFSIQLTNGCLASGSGFLPGLDIPPTNTIASAVEVRWEFFGPTIPPGSKSEHLYINSACGPAVIPAGVNGDFSHDAQTTALGPGVPPQVASCDIDVMKQACVVLPPDVNSDDCDSDVQDMEFEYTGENCSASSHLQNPKKVTCTGDPSGAPSVRIVATDEKGKKVWGSARGVQVSPNGPHTISAHAASAKEDRLKPMTRFKIYRESDNSLLETVEFDTDCSEPLMVGNKFGSLRLVSMTSHGVTTTTGHPKPRPCISKIDIKPPPHCKGQIKSIRFRYTGADCSLTNNDQGTADVCTQVNPPTANPVTIKVANSSMSNVFLLQTPVNVGAIVDATAANGGQTYLPTATYFWITDTVTNQVIQTGKLVTNCQDNCSGTQPLNLGNTFGALQIFALDTTGGGTLALGANVEYRYKVTNIGTNTVDTVNLLDNQIGVVPGSPVGPLSPSQMVTLTTIVPDISTTTTNTVTATGFIGASQCDQAGATATVTVNMPEPPHDVCACSVQKMLLRYTGPDVNGATVEITPDLSPPATYGPINLTNGTVLSSNSEIGFTLSARPDKGSLGSKVKIKINGEEEDIDTSCKKPFVSNAPAPLVSTNGAHSAKWHVVDFKDCGGRDDNADSDDGRDRHR